MARGAAERLPRRIEDSRLGVLRRVRGGSSFAGEVVTRKGTIEIDIEVIDGPVERAIERAKAIVRAVERHSAAAKRYASANLLRLKNETWIDETTPVSDLQFRRRLELERIDVAPDLSVTFWYRDGDLFWGHFVRVELNRRDRPISAELPG